VLASNQFVQAFTPPVRVIPETAVTAALVIVWNILGPSRAALVEILDSNKGSSNPCLGASFTVAAFPQVVLTGEELKLDEYVSV
jgi:hypothetical protein